MNILCTKTELGEGVFWDASQEVLYWLDINNYKLFSLRKEMTCSYSLNEKASAILDVRGGSVYMASESGILSFTPKLNETFQISQIPMKYLSKKYRANDGIKISKNNFVYGVMNNNPAKGDGAIIISKNGLDSIVYEGISIPNTFIRLPNTNSILISDSFEKKIFKFNFNSSWDYILDYSLWLDLNDSNRIPDGGCMSTLGRIFISIWDGFEVLELDIDGNIVDTLPLPVPRPTDCVLNTIENCLFVSTAFEGLSKKTQQEFPLSGSLLKIKVKI